MEENSVSVSGSLKSHHFPNKNAGKAKHTSRSYDEPDQIFSRKIYIEDEIRLIKKVSEDALEFPQVSTHVTASLLQEQEKKINNENHDSSVALVQYCTQLLICALSAISGFLFGYDLCVMVIALPLIQESFSLKTEHAEAVVSILMIGAVFGSFLGGPTADWIGRKLAIFVTGIFFFLGSVLMTFSESYQAMLVGRFLAGIAVGSSGPCVSVYISEIARSEHRGALVTVYEVMLCFGCVVSVAVSGFLRHSESGWRKMLGLTMFPPLVQLLGMPFMPESPRWLLMRDREQEAITVLKRLYSEKETSVQLQAQKSALLSRNKIHYSLKDELKNSLRKILFHDLSRLRVVLSLAVAVCQTLTGASAMLYYSSYIMKALNPVQVTKEADVSKEIRVAMSKLAGVCCAIVIVDRIGRRKLLLFGSGVMMLCHLIFAGCFWSLSLKSTSEDVHSTPTKWNEHLRQTAVTTMYIFIFAWNISWAPLMWVVCSELLPNDLRSLGMGVTFAAFWFASAVINQTLLSLFHALGMANTFFLYASLTACTIVFVYTKIPETKGLSFEQISSLFARKHRQMM